MATTSQTLAEFVGSLRFADLPPEVAARARRHLVDALGVMLAASTDAVADPIIGMTRSWAGARESSVVGSDVRAPAAWAAMVNGTLARALDFDDTHPESLVHPSSVVIPAALAVGEEVGASRSELLAAIVAGYEVCARVGAAAPGRFHARGLSTTGVCGPFGAAAAAASLWGLTTDEIAHALGLVASMAGGVLAAPADGASAAQAHAGRAAHAGVIAADLARRGAQGPPTIFDGPHGIFDAFLADEEVDRARVRAELGTRWETSRIAIKPYPASHFVLAFVDAAARAGVKWADIDEIVCAVAPPVIPIVAEPRAARLHPATDEQARRSLPFAVATAIVGGRDALDLFGADARTDRRVLTLAERVRHEPDPTLPFPRTYGGRLQIHTRSGRTIEIDETTDRGHPDRPLSDDEVAEKFMRNARGRLGHKGARRVLTTLQNAEQATVEQLAALVRTP